MALQEVVHVLRNTGCKRTVLSYSFPKGKEEVCRIFVLEKQVNLINEDIGVLAFRSVLSNSVKNGVKNNEHTDRHKLLTKIENVIANQTVVGVNVGLLCKGVKRTVSEQLNGKGDFSCFRFVLLQEFSTEVLQGRYSTRVIVLLIRAINTCGTTVDNGLLLCTEIVTADELFAKGHNELRLEDNGVRTVTVILVHIHSVDMVRRCCRDIDNLTAHCINKGRILTLRINDDYVCRRISKHNIGNLSLCGKGLT